MSATTVDTTAADTRAATKRKPVKGPSTPWWLYVIVLAIVVFCLLPFYWLVNISLKTGPDLSSANLVPPHPSLKKLHLDLSKLELHARAGQQRHREPHHHLHRRDRRVLRGLRARAPPDARQVHPARHRALDHHLPADRDRRPPVPALVKPARRAAAPLQHPDRPDHPLPDLRAAAVDLHLVSFFREIPRDLEEAALVDGATNFEAFRKVVVPLAAPGLATTAILTFIAAWNEFLLATTLTSSTTARTVPVAISQFTGSSEFEVPLGTQSAASVVISIPLIVLVLLFQRRIVAGLPAGAVKG
jgi:multiple sugar transport system permease protein